MNPLSQNMGKLTLDKAEAGGPHYLYDLSIENLEERRERKKKFDSAKLLAAFIGVPTEEIYDKRSVGHKIFSPRFQGWFAIRIAHEK